MKKALVILFLVSFCAVHSQEKNEIDISKLRAPSSPSSKIFGKENNSITRPKSWNELETSLFADFLTSDGDINFNRLINLEFSPYWLKKDRKISNEEFILQKDKLNNLAQNFSISISSDTNYIIPDSIFANNSSISLGIRSMLWKGSKLEEEELKRRYKVIQDEIVFVTRLLPILNNMDCNNCIREDYVSDFVILLKANKDQIFPTNIDDIRVLDIIDKIKEHLLENLPRDSTDGKNYRDYINELSKNKFISELKANVLTLEEMISDRKGFKLEIAAAMILDFPSNETNFSTVPTYAFWLTPSYQPFDTNWIEFLAIVRYQKHFMDYYSSFLNQEQFPDRETDLGLKLVFKSEKIAFELEGLTRSQKVFSLDDQNTKVFENTSDTKYVGRISYNVSSSFVLSFDFGKDFNQFGFSTDNNLITQFGINYAIGQVKANKIKNID